MRILEILALAVEQPGFRPTLPFHCFKYTGQIKKSTHYFMKISSRERSGLAMSGSFVEQWHQRGCSTVTFP